MQTAMIEHFRRFTDGISLTHTDGPMDLDLAIDRCELGGVSPVCARRVVTVETGLLVAVYPVKGRDFGPSLPHTFGRQALQWFASQREAV